MNYTEQVNEALIELKTALARLEIANEIIQENASKDNEPLCHAITSTKKAIISLRSAKRIFASGSYC